MVVTLHDAKYWRFPETLSHGTRLYYRPALSYRFRRGQISLLLSPSLTAASDVRRHVPSSIEVVGIPLGVAPPTQRPATPTATDSPLATGDYMLAVGTLEPRKNYATLFEALRLLTERDLNVPVLKIVGRQGWGPELRPPPAIDPFVELLGSVDEERLTDLYRNARLFVMPSRSEGFGLPLVEAMRAGCTCVVSDIPALRELGADTVRYVVPGEPMRWADALAQAVAATAIARSPNRQAMLRAHSFTWERWASETAQAYERATQAVRDY